MFIRTGTWKSMKHGTSRVSSDEYMYVYLFDMALPGIPLAYAHLTRLIDADTQITKWS